MSQNLNLTSPINVNYWKLNNVSSITSPVGNSLVVSGYLAPSVLNFNGSNVDVSGNLNLNGNLKVPVGNLATRPAGVQGYLRYNTTNSFMQFYDGTYWLNLITAVVTITNPNGLVLNTLWQPGFTYTFSYITPANSTYYTITTNGTIVANFLLNGAGGGGGSYANGSITNPTIGGNGGQTTGTYTLVAGTTYYLLVGAGGAFVKDYGGQPAVGAGGGGNVGTSGFGGQGGGYTGLFSNTPFSQVNAIMMAGGGGGGSWEVNPSTPSGGAGGGLSGTSGASGVQAGGGGGTQIAGGSSYPGGPSQNGAALLGGTAAGGDAGNGGGGGGGGYYGGGGGNGENSGLGGSGGGGGSGYLSPSVVSGTTTAGAGSAGGVGMPGGQNVVTYGVNGIATMSYVN